MQPVRTRGRRASLTFPGLSLFGLLLLAASAAAVWAQEGQGPADPDVIYEQPGENPLLGHVQGPESDVIDLLPSQDTFITSGLPNSNYGNHESVWVGYDLTTGWAAERTYFQFDVSFIPDNSIINSATLFVYKHTAVPASDAPMGIILRHLNEGWNALTLTWNNNPPAWGGIALEAASDGGTGWRLIGMTTLVEQWANETRPNYGLVVIGDETVQDRERGYFSRNAPAEFRPYLRIDYTPTNDGTPPTAAITPFPSPYTNEESLLVQWSGMDNPGGTGIEYYDVQYRLSSQATWVDWQVHTAATQATFTGEEQTYLFRARAIDHAGNASEWSAAESISIDVTAPTAAVNQFSDPVIQQKEFVVAWTGTDGSGSGIEYYDVQYRIDNGAWIPWQSQTIGNSAPFVALSDGVYQFEARAADNAGNVEAYANEPEAAIIVDTEPPFVTARLWLPAGLNE